MMRPSTRPFFHLHLLNEGRGPSQVSQRTFHGPLVNQGANEPTGLYSHILKERPVGLTSTKGSLGNVPPAVLRELNAWFLDVFDHPRLTERGVKFFLRKVESFEEVSWRAGRGWVWERGKEGRPLLLVTGLGKAFSGHQGSCEACPRL